MSRYKELASKATNYSAIFYAYRNKCQTFAWSFAHRLNAFLEIPGGKLLFVKLDDELKPTSETERLNCAPNMTLGCDGLWYFSIQLVFEDCQQSKVGTSTIVFGVNEVIGGFTISLSLDRSFDIDVSNDESFTPLLTRIYDGLLEEYSKAPYRLPTQIGFKLMTYEASVPEGSQHLTNPQT